MNRNGFLTQVTEARQVLASFDEIKIQEVQMCKKAQEHLISLYYEIEETEESSLDSDLKACYNDCRAEAVKNEIMTDAEFDAIYNALDTMATLAAQAYA